MVIRPISDCSGKCFCKISVILSQSDYRCSNEFIALFGFVSFNIYIYSRPKKTHIIGSVFINF
uniref:Uncharacterized protein n=1 Tax=Octopus bimaculoides TaxID=37653 RepID=A0A0L8H650_OCTBM